jgi:hypothetical protein
LRPSLRLGSQARIKNGTRGNMLKQKMQPPAWITPV